MRTAVQAHIHKNGSFVAKMIKRTIPELLTKKRLALAHT